MVYEDGKRYPASRWFMAPCKQSCCGKSYSFPWHGVGMFLRIIFEDQINKPIFHPDSTVQRRILLKCSCVSYVV